MSKILYKGSETFASKLVNCILEVERRASLSEEQKHAERGKGREEESRDVCCKGERGEENKWKKRGTGE